mmetsp:Transcript_33014/g.71964  ORF Transcript_33014/g.71964 Transcript_33014/m.71964 type:complete len:374 (-) Transcript_33014:159-1280(-)
MTKDDAMKAFENEDARAVAKIALSVLRTKVNCLAFLGKVMEAVSNGPDEQLPAEEQPEAQNEGRKDAPRTEKRKEPHSEANDRPDAKRSQHSTGAPSGYDGDFSFLEPDIEDNQGSLFFLIPNVVAGAIIGKAGITLKSMQRKTGAKVEVERQQGGADVRLVCCFGSLRQVTMAAQQVMDLANLDSVTLLVPNEICGMIIGKQGSNIKKLERETGAHLKVESDFDQVRRIFVGGDLSKRCHALYLIASLISANEPRVGPFDPRRLPPPPPEPLGRDSHGRDSRGPMGPSGHGPPPPPPPYQDIAYTARLPRGGMPLQEEPLPPAANINLMTQQQMMLQQMAQLQAELANQQSQLEGLNMQAYRQPGGYGGRGY